MRSEGVAVVFGFGVEVVGRAWTAGAWQRGEWRGLQGQVAVGCCEDAVVVDGGYVRVGGGLGQEDARGQQESGGLCAEDAAVGLHGPETLGGRVPRWSGLVHDAAEVCDRFLLWFGCVELCRIRSDLGGTEK